MSGHQTPGASPLRVVRAVIVAMLVFTFAQVLAGPAVAGDEPPAATPGTEPAAEPTVAPTEPSTDEQIKVAAILCNDWSCHEFGDRIDGFTITAIDIDTRESLGSCVTDVSSEFEGCWLEIPAGAHWTLTFDDDETPEGYIYHGSIIAVSGGAYGEITYVPFHPLVDPEPGHMVVQAALCTDASCDEYEKYLDNFLISAVNPETGQEYSGCMTDNLQQNLDHQCILDVPAKGLVELQWVEDQVPDGYVPFGEPILSDDGVTTLAFVPEDDAPPATEAPVTSLPVTGAGTGDHNRPLGAVVLATVLLGILGAAFVTGSRTRHR